MLIYIRLNKDMTYKLAMRGPITGGPYFVARFMMGILRLQL